MNGEGDHRKPVAAFALSGCDHELTACAPVRHETRMRCPGRCPHREGIGAGDLVAVTRSSMCLVSVLCSSGRITVLSPSCVINVCVELSECSPSNGRRRPFPLPAPTGADTEPRPPDRAGYPVLPTEPIAVGTDDHGPSARTCGDFGGLADDRFELRAQPLLVLADQRPELGVNCPGTEHRAGVTTAQHRHITP